MSFRRGGRISRFVPEEIHVLLVDDEPGFAEMVGAQLEREKEAITATGTTCVEEALSLLRAEQFDVVVSDYEMAQYDGLEFLDLVREEFTDLPFLLFTGKGSEEIASRAISRGVTDYLQKGSTETYELLANRIEHAVARARAERAAEARERRLERLLQGSSDVITVIDSFGTVQYASPSIERFLGDDPDAFVGENVFDYVHPEDTDRVMETFLDAVEDPRQLPTAEYRFRDADGGWHWLESRGSDRIEEPDLTGFIVNAREITERKERERELERYKTIVDLAGDPIYTLDEDATLTFVSKGTSDLSGYEPDELVGEPVSTVMTDADIERGEQVIRELLLDDEDSGTFEMELLARDGRRVPCENHVALLEDEDGTFRGTVGILRDISEQKERQRQLERQNEHLEEFTSMVSHDLRNPLNVAQGRLSMARDEYDCEHHDGIGDALERMERLIEDLLELAQQGQKIKDPDPVDLGGVVGVVSSTVAADAALDSRVDGVAVLADRDRLVQVFENLFRNSVEQADGDVTVRVGLLSDGAGFYVADDGPGILPDERDRVFERGYSTEDSGTGFGLFIVRSIVDAHGWEIHVTESDRGGARFEITGVQVATSVGGA